MRLYTVVVYHLRIGIMEDNPGTKSIRGDNCVFGSESILCDLTHSFSLCCVCLSRTELVVYVMERPQMGPAKRCLASDVCNALNSPAMKQQINSQLNVESITAKVLTKDQLKQYLDNPPAGEYLLNECICHENM